MLSRRRFLSFLGLAPFCVPPAVSALSATKTDLLSIYRKLAEATYGPAPDYVPLLPRRVVLRDVGSRGGPSSHGVCWRSTMNRRRFLSFLGLTPFCVPTAVASLSAMRRTIVTKEVAAILPRGEDIIPRASFPHRIALVRWNDSAFDYSRATSPYLTQKSIR